MSFISPVQPFRRHGEECSRVDVTLTVINANGEIEQPFRFDTGCDITTVSEDVAATLGLPAGGTVIRVSGVTGVGAGRLVAVTFRFPPDAISGLPAAAVTSTWFVVAGQTGIALLSLQDAHARYFIGTDDQYMYFTNR
jgi:Aspartyl protease